MEMASYKKMRVTELQQACKMQGLEHEGLNKKGLILALQKHTMHREETGDEVNDRPDVEPDSDREVSFRRNVDQSDNGESNEETSTMWEVRLVENVGAESLSLLELNLAIAREEREKINAEKERAESAWLIEKQRLEMGLGSGIDTTQPNFGNDIARLLPKMIEGEPLVFFSAFERTLMLNDVHKKNRTKFLGGTLTFKAHKALSGLTVSQLQDYEVCKKTELDYYRLDAAEYLKRFRTARREPAELHKMFRARLNDYLSYHVDACRITTFENLYDDVLLQQLMYNLTPDVKAFVFARQPKTAEEASNFADLQSQVTRGATGNTSQVPSMGSTHSRSERPSLPLPKLSSLQGNRASGANGAPNKRPACFTCGSLEHKRIACPLENRTINSVRPNYSVCG